MHHSSGEDVRECRAVVRARCDHVRARCDSGMRDADISKVHVPEHFGQVTPPAAIMALPCLAALHDSPSHACITCLLPLILCMLASACIR